MHSLDSLIQRFPTGIQLREDTQVWRFADADLRVSARGAMRLANVRSEDIEFLNALRLGLEAAAIIESRGDSRRRPLLQALSRIGALRHRVSEKPVEPRLDRQRDWLSYSVSDPESIEDRISVTRILILGCGGTGALIAQHLARCGFRHFVLVDGGTVDSPDLNRQLPYSTESLGRPKAPELARFLLNHERATTAEAHRMLIESESDACGAVRMSCPDFIVSAMDQPIGRISPWIAEAAAEAGKPVIFGGVGIEDATIGPLLEHPAACRSYAKAMAKAGSRLRSSGRIPKASIVFTNTIVAAQLAFDVFRYFARTESPVAMNRTLNLSFPSLELTEKARWDAKYEEGPDASFRENTSDPSSDSDRGDD